VGLLVSALRRAGIQVQRTREPGGSPGAEDIRKLLLEGGSDRWDETSEVLLFYAARHDHVTRLIEPALTTGEWVVCDRFTDSTVAYQGYGRGFSLDKLAALRRIALGTFAPNLTFILDIPVDDGLSRVGRRSLVADRFERLHEEFHQRLRDGFLAIAAAEPERCAVIDASGDISTVHRAIVATISIRLGIVFK
jgi:dTMP kinase